MGRADATGGLVTGDIDGESAPVSPLITAYCEVLVRRRWWCAALIVAMVGASAPFAGKFPGACSTAFDPPHASPAYKDRETLEQHFPRLAQSSDVVLYAERADRSEVRSDELLNFSHLLNSTVRGWPEGGRIENETGVPFVLAMTGYYSMLDSAGPEAAAQFISTHPANVSTFFDISISVAMTGQPAIHFARWLKDQISDLNRETGCAEMGYKFTLLGAPAFMDIILESTESDLAHMDAIVLPIAVLILAMIVKSLRLMIAPLLCLGWSAAISFAIMYGVAQLMDVFSGASALMMSVLIAMSIDYGLFLLTRYREELERGVGSTLAVERMLSSAGHTIAVSGITLAVCFGALCFLPNPFMISLGLGCGILIIIILLMNLFITPLLLLNFPAFFEKSLIPGPICPPRLWCGSAEQRGEVAESLRCCGGGGGGEDAGAATGPTGETGVTAVTVTWGADEDGAVHDPGDIDEKEELLDPAPGRPSLEDSVWYRFAGVATRMPYNILLILVVVGAVFYPSMYATTYEVTNNNMYYLPRHTAVADAYGRMGDTFGYGQVWSYQLLVIPTDNGTFSTSSANGTAGDTWLRAQAMFADLEKHVPATGVGNIQSVMYAGVNGQSQRIQKSLVETCVQACVAHTGPTPCLPQLNALASAYQQFVNEDATAAWARFTPAFAPMGKDGKHWLLDARDLADSFPAKYSLSMKFIGQAADGVDAMDYLYMEFPTVIVATCCVVCLIVGVAFRSVAIPLRSVATIGLTLFFVQGLAALVYEHGIWNWVGFDGFKSTHAVIYINPLMSFSIIVGVGLDYDIFLITRIIEYRKMFAALNPEQEPRELTRRAIMSGLAKTGWIITAAGVIMAVAFSGLLLSGEPIMNQLAFYMVFAVIFDTFIVRPIMVPAMMSLLYELNWWPCTITGCGTTAVPADAAYDAKDPRVQINDADQ